jgi:hypothetical protein
MAEQVRVAAVVPWERCVDFATRAYEATGMPRDKARDAAVAIVDADLHGTVTHGLKNLRGYVTELKAGNFNPNPNIRVVGGPKAAAIIDADNAQGHVAATFGMRKAIELAKEYSFGSAFVRSSNHYGHSGFWSSMAVRHNMVGIRDHELVGRHCAIRRQGRADRQQSSIVGDPDAGCRSVGRATGLRVSARLSRHGVERRRGQPP